MSAEVTLLQHFSESLFSFDTNAKFSEFSSKGRESKKILKHHLLTSNITLMATCC